MANVWDSLIGFFSPETAMRNKVARNSIAKFEEDAKNGFNKRKYAGARTTPGQSNYWLGGGDPNSDIRADRQKVAERIRQLVRDMPWLDGAMEAAVSYKIGEGFTAKPSVRKTTRAKKGEIPALDEVVNTKIKDAWLRWCEHAEINGRDNFDDIQQQLIRQMFECGEGIALHRYGKNNEYRLQLFEPDLIQSFGNASDIDQGIKFDPHTNEFLEYHFVNNYSTPDLAGQEFVVPAKDVIHLFRQLRPWQRRGISPLVQTVLLAADLDEYIGNEVEAQQMASRYLAILTDPSGEGSDSGFAREQVDSLTMLTVGGGKTFQFAPGAARPTTGVEAFQKMFLRILSVILKVPYHLISGDYAAMNYNTLREIRNNTLHLLKKDWWYHTSHFLNPVYRRWMDWAVLSGKLDLRGYETPEGRLRYQSVIWCPPGIESPDLLRDIKAVVEGAQFGIINPEQWMMQNGEDPEEILASCKEFADKTKALREVFKMPSTTVKNAPSANGDNTNQE